MPVSDAGTFSTSSSIGGVGGSFDETRNFKPISMEFFTTLYFSGQKLTTFYNYCFMFEVYPSLAVVDVLPLGFCRQYRRNISIVVRSFGRLARYEWCPSVENGKMNE